MNFKVNESSQKLSGSYYTPEWIAEFVAKWVLKYDVKSILEPSCGDGVFFSAIAKQAAARRLQMLGFDTDPVAIEKCKNKIFPDEIKAEFSYGDYLEWAIENIKADEPKKFDAVVGNPPFIRYQYLEKDQQERAQQLFDLLGLKFTKHTNAWIPFVISSIEFLKPGGIIGMVIPSEIIHVLYAQGARDFLLNKCSRILLLDPEDLWFEDTLPFNESWGIRNILTDRCQQAFAVSAYHLTKALDDTRLVSTNDGWEQVTSDICGIHDYFDNANTFRKKYKDMDCLLASDAQGRKIYADGFSFTGQPIIISEYGGIAYGKAEDGAWGYNSNADNQYALLDRIKDVTLPILESKQIAGYCYTQLTDVMQEINGLANANHEPKVDFVQTRDIFG